VHQHDRRVVHAAEENDSKRQQQQAAIEGCRQWQHQEEQEDAQHAPRQQQCGCELDAGNFPNGCGSEEKSYRRTQHQIGTVVQAVGGGPGGKYQVGTNGVTGPPVGIGIDQMAGAAKRRPGKCQAQQPGQNGECAPGIFAGRHVGAESIYRPGQQACQYDPGQWLEPAKDEHQNRHREVAKYRRGDSVRQTIHWQSDK